MLRHVLLVEDEVLLCWLLEQMLSDGGYNVRIETTGDGGLAALEQGLPLDALVTNIRLADGPDGFELARHARRLYPSIAVVYVSGDSAARHEDDGVPGSTMLAKPFEAEQLTGILSGLLDA